MCGRQKEGEVFNAQDTLIINLSFLAFLKNLPGLPVEILGVYEGITKSIKLMVILFILHPLVPTCVYSDEMFTLDDALSKVNANSSLADGSVDD